MNSPHKGQWRGALMWFGTPSVSLWHHCNVSRWLIWGFATTHDDVIKWKHFPRYWPFVRGIHQSPVNSPHKGQWRGALMFSLICVQINGWVNNGEAGVMRRHRSHYDVTVMRTLYNHWVTTVNCNYISNTDFCASLLLWTNRNGNFRYTSYIYIV